MTKHSVEIIHEGKFAAEVPIVLIEDDGGWEPRVSLDDARKIELVRRALKVGDLATAIRLAKVYELKPVAAE
jgi:choline dehydrogenase-like flavoprotein